MTSRYSPVNHCNSRIFNTTLALLAGLLIALMSTASLAADASAQALADRILAERPPMVGRSISNRAQVASRLESAYSNARKNYGDDSLQAVDARMLLGHAVDDARAKRKLYDVAIAKAEQLLGREHDLYGRYLLEAATGLINDRAHRQQDDYLDRAEAFFAPSAPSLPYVQIQLARALLHDQSGDVDAALTAYNRAVNRAEPIRGKNAKVNGLQQFALRQLVRLAAQNDRPELSAKHCRALARNAAKDGNAAVTQAYAVRPVNPMKDAQGKVTYSFDVQTDGRVANVTIENVEGPPELGNALLEVTGRWRFSPRLKDGEFITVRLRNQYVFGEDGAAPGG